MSSDAIRIRNLAFSRGQKTIYDDISLDVKAGSVTAVMGPSGIGKTTLLKLIGGQLVPDSGYVEVADTRLDQITRPQLFELRKSMSMLFQSGALFTNLTVFENVAFPLREHTRLTESMINTIVKLKLEAVGLRGAMQLMPSELSGGMGRRAALARAIALDPQLVLYDEPFAGQDPISMAVLVKLIKTLNHALGLTSVVVTHDVSEVLNIADYVYILANKKIIGEGTPSEIRAHNSELVQQFLNGKSDGPVPFHYPAETVAEDFLSQASINCTDAGGQAR